MRKQAEETGILHHINPLRQKLLRRLTTTGMVAVMICYPVMLLRISVFGFKPINTVQSLLVCILLGLFLSRKHLSLWVSAAGLLLGIMTFVLAGVGNYGVFAPAHLTVPFITILASIAFGHKVALRLCWISTACLGLIAGLYLSGVLHYQVDVLVYAHSWTSWVSLLVMQTLLALWYLFMVAPINETHRRLAERLEAVLQGINDALFIHDKDTGAILQVNQRTCEMFGYSEEEALRLNIGELSEKSPPYDFEHARAWMVKAEKEGDQLFEWRAKDRQGRVFWVEVSMRLARLDGTERILVVVRDISARKQADRDIAMLKHFIDFHRDGAYWTDADGRIIYSNEAGCTALGYPAGELIGKNVQAVNPRATPEAWRQVWDRLRDQGVFRAESVHRRKDGSEFPVEVTSSYVRFDGSEYNCAFVRDITERKLAEQAQQKVQARLEQTQKLEAIGTLAGGIAHDFNNILGGIVGYTDLALLELPDGSPAREMLENVGHGVARATGLVRQILTFSRQTKLDRKPLQPALIVKEALQLLRASLPATITVSNRCESSAWVLADAGQVHQIVMNLCTNAGLAMRERGGVLDVGLHELESDSALPAKHPELTPGRYLCLTVKDTGCGIRPENLGRIFEPFFTTRPAGEGTGLGLSVVHGIVKSWGGAIEVESVVGRGTTFQLFLPVCQETAKAGGEKKAPHQGQERVLFVDDEIDLTEVARRGLARFGYAVTAFNDPVKALAAFRSSPRDFDIVVTDMTMPGLTGDILATEVRSLRPEIPVVLVSGFSDRLTEKQALAAGFDGFADKPLRSTTLAQLIRKLCDRG